MPTATWMAAAELCDCISIPMTSGKRLDRRRVVRRTSLAMALFALAVVLYGGYGHHWSWTGINGHTATLWDWLHLLLLPVAFGVLPVVIGREIAVRRRHKLAGSALLAVFVA